MLAIISLALTLQSADPRFDPFCRDARAVAHIIGEQAVIARARMAGAPAWKLEKTLRCFMDEQQRRIENGRY
jgi:hypothetical protein